MFLVIGVTFGVFLCWQLVGSKLAAKNRARSGGMYQVAAVVAFLAGAYIGMRVEPDLPPLFPDWPALSVLIATTLVPVGCGTVGGLVVWAWVAMLPVAPASKSQRAAVHNPFDDTPE